MRNKIIEHIKQLEKEQNIQILIAIESGSRAWGCPSPDSDFDVRIIYKRSKAEYLEIDEKPDTINYFHGDLLDINGWDIKKTLKLIRKSNATPFEWVQSPIVYHEIPGSRKTILDLCKTYFQPRHSINHYLGIAKNSYATNNESGEMKLKKLFYVLRPLMAALWIIEKKEIPPMDIPNLMDIIRNDTISAHINKLLKIKDTANEDYVHKVDSLITDYISFAIEKISSAQIEHNITQSSDLLNKTFKQIIED